MNTQVVQEVLEQNRRLNKENDELLNDFGEAVFEELSLKDHLRKDQQFFMHRVNNMLYAGITVDEEAGLVQALISEHKGDPNTVEVQLGTAYCDFKDDFDIEKGKRTALKRALRNISQKYHKELFEGFGLKPPKEEKTSRKNNLSMEELLDTIAKVLNPLRQV